MTSDDQFFFDFLANIPNDVRRYSLDVADSIDRHVEHAASVIRETLASQTWLPAIVKPISKNNAVVRCSSPPQSVRERACDWMLHHRAWTAAIVGFFGTGGFLLFGSYALNTRKRKARRAANGARKEIVVIAGSPHEPLTRSLASDLERRGFIVFITVLSVEEEHVVQSENRADIRTLYLDITTALSSPSDIDPSLSPIYTLMTQPQYPYPGVQPHTCQFSGLIILPSPNYVMGPLPTVQPSSWADTINTRLLNPILTTQLFLPLLTHRNRNHSSSIVFLYPSISSSLSAPFAGPEVTVIRGLAGFASTLRQELRMLHLANDQPCNVDVVELKLGNIDLGSQYRNSHGTVPGSDMLAWSPRQRALYGPAYMSTIEQKPLASNGPGAVRGSPSRYLHYAVFDALAPSSKSIFGRRKRKKAVIYVGRGARSYGIIGDWIPRGLIGWMLGFNGS